MSYLCCISLMMLTYAGIDDKAGEFVAKRYQQPDGAITVYVDGDNVDPYFSIKALLAAHAHGLDIRRSAEAWIEWLIPKQLSDGRFERYCRQPGETWQSCAPADADDALLALWLEILHALSPDKGLPTRWRQSATRAEKHLSTLLDRELGVYRVSQEQPIALLMDNVEVYAALSAVARHQKRFGLHAKSRKTAVKAKNLRRAIDRVFWQSNLRMYRASLHEEPVDRFYPDIVAQIYPWLAGMNTPAGNKLKEYMRWREQYAQDWLTLELDEFPWGLVALASLKFHDRETALRWYESASPLRHSPRWNILEEAAYQIIAFDLCCRSVSYFGAYVLREES